MALFALAVVKGDLLENFEWSTVVEKNEELAWTFGFECNVQQWLYLDFGDTANVQSLADVLPFDDRMLGRQSL